jgi:Holliday junction resolvase-like predicted endonuclease
VKQIGIWHVTDAGPKKLSAGSLDLERQLEEWIERDPGLLENGFTIVGRQVRVEAGPLDLLAVDPQGRWAVIEIKRGAVYRDTLAQALDYAACISAMPHELLAEKVNEYLRARSPEEPADLETLLSGRAGAADGQDDSREVRVFLVGTGRDPGLDRLVDFLSGIHGVPISVVSFEVYEVADGQRVLVRELTESEAGPPGPAVSALPTTEEICSRADRGGIGAQFRAILETARRHELYPRPFKRSLMFAPPSNHTRSLFTIWADPPGPGQMWMWLGPEAFAQFYPVTEQDVVGQLGNGGWRRLQPADLTAFVAGLDRLFQMVNEPQ